MQSVRKCALCDWYAILIQQLCRVLANLTGMLQNANIIPSYFCASQWVLAKEVFCFHHFLVFLMSFRATRFYEVSTNEKMKIISSATKFVPAFHALMFRTRHMIWNKLNSKCRYENVFRSNLSKPYCFSKLYWLYSGPHHDTICISHLCIHSTVSSFFWEKYGRCVRNGPELQECLKIWMTTLLYIACPSF